MAGELASALAASGHQVLVITPFPNRSWGRIADGYRRRVFERRKTAFERLMVPTWLLGKRRKWYNRLLENVTFGLASAAALLLSKSGDVLLLETWPIAAEWLASVAARLKGMPVINYRKDVYPEALVSAGFLREGSWIARRLVALDRVVLRRAARTIAISDSMADDLSRTRGIAKNRFEVVRDWLDLSCLRPSGEGGRWRERAGLPPGAFVCLFAGTMGYASGVRSLAEAASCLRHETDVYVVCVGDGAVKAQLEAIKTERALSNLLLLPFQPRDEVAACQSAADVLLLPTAAGMGTSSVPSKFITYLAMARPVLCAVKADSEIARTVRGRSCGLVVEPEDGQAIARAIVELKHLTVDQRREMGRNARALAEERHSMTRAVREIEALIARVAGEDRLAS